MVLVKPDGVRRGFVGEVIGRFERKGFKISALRMLKLDSKLANDFYSPHVGKPFFPELEKFITSESIVAVVLEGDNAVDVVRRMIGITKSSEAASGTIRGDLSLGYTNNVVHASDSLESFKRESKIIFPDIE